MMIEVLPAELLVLIFEYGCQITLLESGNIPFAVILSHVCRQWRQLVYASASLWRAVPSTSLILLATYLKLSQDYTLDVFLHARPRVSDVEISLIVDLLLDHSHRWRSLHIRVHSSTVLFVVITRLVKAKAARLRRFELYVDAPQHTIGRLPPVFVDDPPPMLDSITLEGIGIESLIGKHFLSGLESLSLARQPTVRSRGPIGHPDFKVLLHSSPGLKHLSLDRFTPNFIPGVKYDEIKLLDLQSLDLVLSQYMPWVQQFVRVLTAPSLRIFRYDSASNRSWEQFEKSLPIMSSKYRNLQELHLTIRMPVGSSAAQAGVAPEFFTAFPKLKALSLTVSDDVHAAYFLDPWIAIMSGDDELEVFHDALSDDTAGEDFELAVGDVIVWPDLKLLTVRAPYDSASLVDLDVRLNMLGSLRLSLGLPLVLLKESSALLSDNIIITIPSTNAHPMDAPPRYE